MFTLGRWRAALAAFGVAVAATFLLVGISPAQACTCPATGQPSTGNMCPNSTTPPFTYSACPTSSSSGPISITPRLDATEYVRYRQNSLDNPNYTGSTNDGFDLDKFMKDNPQYFPEYQSTVGTGTKHLGVAVGTPDVPISIDTRGGGSNVSYSGATITDTAGAVAASTLATSSRTTFANAGAGATFDVSRLFSVPGSLQLRAGLDYDHADMSYGTNAPLAAAGIFSAGSLSRDQYTVSGTFDYDARGAYYLKGGVAVGVGNGVLNNSVTGGVGNFNNNNYAVGLAAGKVFTLFDMVNGGSSAGIFTKAPTKPASGGYVIGLDLSGNVGYFNSRDGGFTDSAGFTNGAEQMQYGDIGARAKLFAVVPGSNLLWMPYVEATVDQRVGYSHTLAIPNQALAAADTLSFNDATTFWGGRLGIDARTRNGWTIGVSGFYNASSDTKIVGGTAFLKIPLDLLMSARY